MTERVISDSRLIPAPPSAIFTLLSDASQHGTFDGSDTVKGARASGPVPLQLGTKFSMSMKIGPIPYKITNTVVEFEENSLIAWKHFGGHIWRYQLKAAEGGTLVTESFDWNTAVFPAVYRMAGYLEAHPRNIAASLERLEQLFSKD